MQCSEYRICLIRRRGYYLFHRAILCGFYSRAAFIKLSVLGKIFRNCKGIEKSQFYKINEELRCGDLVLKQTFQLDQPPLCYKAVPTRHLQSVSSFSSNDFTRWSPSVPQKMTKFSGQPAFLYLSTGYRVLAAASIRERRLFRSACPEVRRQFESGI